MSIADVPSRGWSAQVPRLSRDSLPVGWYTTLRCPLPAQVPDLRVPVALWWQLTASQPHCSLVILHGTHQLQGPGQARCAFTFAHTACSFRVHPTPQHTHTHTHQSHGGNGICINALIQQTSTSTSSFHGYYMKVFMTDPVFKQPSEQFRFSTHVVSPSVAFFAALGPPAHQSASPFRHFRNLHLPPPNSTLTLGFFSLPGT